MRKIASTVVGKILPYSAFAKNLRTQVMVRNKNGKAEIRKSGSSSYLKYFIPIERGRLQIGRLLTVDEREQILPITVLT